MLVVSTLDSRPLPLHECGGGPRRIGVSHRGVAPCRRVQPVLNDCSSVLRAHVSEAHQDVSRRALAGERRLDVSRDMLRGIAGHAGVQRERYAARQGFRNLGSEIQSAGRVNTASIPEARWCIVRLTSPRWSSVSRIRLQVEVFILRCARISMSR